MGYRKSDYGAAKQKIIQSSEKGNTEIIDSEMEDQPYFDNFEELNIESSNVASSE